jgi:hypothetical protein
MDDREFEILKGMIVEVKTDFKDGFSEFKKEVNDKFAGMEKKIDGFVADHPKVCFFLTDKKNRWKKAGKAIAIIGILIAAPAFVLGMIEIVQKLLGVK